MKWNANPQYLQLILCLCGLAWLAGCQQEVDDSLLNQQADPIAEVGEQRFYESDIDHEILTLPESMRHVMNDPIARAKVLRVMIKRAAVAQKAREMGLDLDPVIAYRMRQAENSVLIDSVRQWQSNYLPKPSLEAVSTYYKQHQNTFKIPEQIHARHILVAEKKQALDILRQLQQDPELFSGLAAHNSIDDSNKSRSGDLNWFARGVMVDAFEAAVFKLHANKRLSRPVKTEFGWHIIEWLGKRESSMPTLEEARPEIISILEKQQLDAWITDLIQQANIDIHKAEYRLQAE